MSSFLSSSMCLCVDSCSCFTSVFMGTLMFTRSFLLYTHTHTHTRTHTHTHTHTCKLWLISFIILSFTSMSTTYTCTQEVVEKKHWFFFFPFFLLLFFFFFFNYNIEGSRPEWCISPIYHAWDTPFWLGTLEYIRDRNQTSWHHFSISRALVCFGFVLFCITERTTSP